MKAMKGLMSLVCSAYLYTSRPFLTGWEILATKTTGLAPLCGEAD